MVGSLYLIIKSLKIDVYSCVSVLAVFFFPLLLHIGIITFLKSTFVRRSSGACALRPVLDRQ